MAGLLPVTALAVHPGLIRWPWPRPQAPCPWIRPGARLGPGAAGPPACRGRHLGRPDPGAGPVPAGSHGPPGAGHRPRCPAGRAPLLRPLRRRPGPRDHVRPCRADRPHRPLLPRHAPRTPGHAPASIPPPCRRGTIACRPTSCQARCSMPRRRWSSGPPPWRGRSSAPWPATWTASCSMTPPMPRGRAPSSRPAPAPSPGWPFMFAPAPIGQPGLPPRSSERGPDPCRSLGAGTTPTGPPPPRLAGPPGARAAGRPRPGPGARPGPARPHTHTLGQCPGQRPPGDVPHWAWLLDVGLRLGAAPGPGPRAGRPAGRPSGSSTRAPWASCGMSCSRAGGRSAATTGSSWAAPFSSSGAPGPPRRLSRPSCHRSRHPPVHIGPGGRAPSQAPVRRASSTCWASGPGTSICSCGRASCRVPRARGPLRGPSSRPPSVWSPCGPPAGRMPWRRPCAGAWPSSRPSAA
ncbi:hypothetical protein H696_06267, partial [Fonticula alba]